MFHVSFLKQNTTKKGRVSKEVLEWDACNKDSKEYKVKIIQDSAIYANKLESSDLTSLYYLIAWKSYTKEENT